MTLRHMLFQYDIVTTRTSYLCSGSLICCSGRLILFHRLLFDCWVLFSRQGANSRLDAMPLQRCNTHCTDSCNVYVPNISCLYSVQCNPGDCIALSKGKLKDNPRCYWIAYRSLFCQDRLMNLAAPSSHFAAHFGFARICTVLLVNRIQYDSTK